MGLIGAGCILASGPWSAVALIILFSRGEQRGDNSFAVALCRFVGAVVAERLGIVAAITLLVQQSCRSLNERACQMASSHD